MLRWLDKFERAYNARWREMHDEGLSEEIESNAEYFNSLEGFMKAFLIKVHTFFVEKSPYVMNGTTLT